MRRQTIRLFFFQLALLLWPWFLLTASARAGEVNTANIGASAGDTLSDAEIQTLLRDNIDAGKLAVGLVVGIVDEHGTRIISHGKLDNGTDHEVDGDSVFEIGSITKVFTVLLLQDMVDRGEMKLDDPVQKYLPASVRMPTYKGKPITLLHLATHTSGLPRVAGNIVSPRSWRNPEAGYTVEQLYDFLSHYRLRREPGARTEYSNLGIALLGYVIALKAGKDYDTLVVERICRPLGMDSTRITLTPELKSRLAIGHAVPGWPVVNEDFSFLVGAGALLSTANDLLKFVSANLGLTPSGLTPLMKQSRAVHRLPSGLQVHLGWFANGCNFSHGDDTLGYQADLRFDLQKKRGVVMLSNCTRTGIIDALEEPLMNGQSLRPSGIVPVDPGLLDSYVGQYQTGNGAIYTARHEGQRFILRWIGHPGERSPCFSFEVYPKSESVFWNKMWDTRATFVRGGQGITLTVSDSKSSFVATRISTTVPETPPPLRIDPKICNGYVGRYRCPFLLACFISVRASTSAAKPTNWATTWSAISPANILTPISPVWQYGCEILPESETVFSAPWLDLRVTFDRNKTGKANHVVIQLNGSTILAARVSGKPAN